MNYRNVNVLRVIILWLCEYKYNTSAIRLCYCYNIVYCVRGIRLCYMRHLRCTGTRYIRDR